MLPTLERIGVAWNPAEANSLAFVTKAREVAKQMDLTLLEANVDNTGAVNEATSSLLARRAQAIWVGGDNTVNAAMGSLIGDRATERDSRLHHSSGRARSRNALRCRAGFLSGWTSGRIARRRDT